MNESRILRTFLLASITNLPDYDELLLRPNSGSGQGIRLLTSQMDSCRSTSVSILRTLLHPGDSYLQHHS